MRYKEKSDNSQQVFQLLKQHYPHAKIILNFSNNFELLVAVILSAQCTDAMVNKVTAKLFPKYRYLRHSGNPPVGGAPRIRFWSSQNDKETNEIREITNFAEADLKELEQDIKPTGFYRNKAKNIKASAKMILGKYHGQLPRTINELTMLPGVARKTANVVLGNAFGISEGIAVDTHVRRLSQRLGFSKQTNPDKIEQNLMKLFPKEQWFPITYLLIEHGRKVCIAQKPKCDQCFLNKICSSAFNFPRFKK